MCTSLFLIARVDHEDPRLQTHLHLRIECQEQRILKSTLQLIDAFVDRVETASMNCREGAI